MNIHSYVNFIFKQFEPILNIVGDTKEQNLFICTFLDYLITDEFFLIAYKEEYLKDFQDLYNEVCLHIKNL